MPPSPEANFYGLGGTAVAHAPIRTSRASSHGKRLVVIPIDLAWIGKFGALLLRAYAVWLSLSPAYPRPNFVITMTINMNKRKRPNSPEEQGRFKKRFGFHLLAEYETTACEKPLFTF